MLPVVLNIAELKIALVGNGKKCVSRLKTLDNLGANYITVYSSDPSKEILNLSNGRLKEYLPDEDDIKDCNVVMVVDLAEKDAEKIAIIARKNKIIVNVEDNKKYCDFYFSSYVKKGDLLVGINTAGKSPALAIRIKDYINEILHDDWGKRLDLIATKRKEWIEAGFSFEKIKSKTYKLIDDNNWIKKKNEG